MPLPWQPSGPYGPGPAPAWLPQPETFGPLSVASQRDEPDNMPALYRRALRLRSAVAPDEQLVRYPHSAPDTLDFTVGPLRCVVNLGAAEVPLPDDAERLLDGLPPDAALTSVPPDAAVWPSTGARAQDRTRGHGREGQETA